MAYRNKHDPSGKSFAAGDKAETSFEKALDRAGLSFRRANFQEEISHVDFFVAGLSDKDVAIDVKARKRVKRSDASVNDELVWVEFQNVAGRRGWLYGKANLIAFERETDFILVNRQLFARLCEKLCDLTRMNEEPRMPLYTGYQRKGRKDILSLIKMSDIISHIKYFLIQK